MSAISTWPRSERVNPPVSVGFVRRWAPFAVGLLAALGGAWWATNSHLFDLRDLRISGNHRLSQAEVGAAAGLVSGTNVLWMSTGSLEARLEANPWIKEAHVARTLPSLVELTLVERTPVALVSPGSLLVARDGTVLGRARGAEPETVPHIVVSGPLPRPGQVLPPLPQLVAARAMPADVLPLVREIGPGPNGTLRVRTRGDVPVLFGDQTDAAAKWEALRSLLLWARRNEVRAEYIDISSPVAPALKPIAASAQEPAAAE